MSAYIGARKTFARLTLASALLGLAACTGGSGATSSSFESSSEATSSSAPVASSSQAPLSSSSIAVSSAAPVSSEASPSEPASSIASSSSAESNLAYRRGEPIVGMDISYWSEQLDRGTTYRDTDGQERDLLDIFKNHGINYIRLRAFVDPSAPYGYTSTAGGCTGKSQAYNGTADIVRMAKRIQAAGMGFLLDFHYSDTWADPGKQVIPWAWRNASSIDELANNVASYTTEVLTTLKNEGITPDMVQVGNETTPGMLIHVPTDSSDCWGNGGRENNITGRANNANWPNLAKLLSAGTNAVKAVDSNILTLLHVENFDHPDGIEWWVDSARNNGVEFDVVGFSAYVEFQGPASVWRSTMQRIANRYQDLSFAIVEYNQEGRLLSDIMMEVSGNRGLGTFFWEATESGFWGDAIFTWQGNTARANGNDFAVYDQLVSDYGLRKIPLGDVAANTPDNGSGNNSSASSSSEAPIQYTVAQADESTWFALVNRESGLAMDILENSSDPGAALVQWQSIEAYNQQFRFIEAANGTYVLQARHSGLVLDVFEFNENDGADIVQWENFTGDNQQFELQRLSNGYYRLVSVFSNKALQPESGTSDSLARITQADPNNSFAQQWQLVGFEEVVDTPLVVTPGPVGECGTSQADVIVAGSPGNYTINGAGAGSNFYQVLNSAISRLSAGRTQQQTVSVRASGDLGTNALNIPSYTVFESCGTINVGNVNGRGSIRVTNARDVSIPHLKMTGSPYFGMEFWGVDNLHLGQIDLRFDGGLGIRFQRDNASSRNVRMDYVYVSGTGNHGVETWNVDGLEIGTVVARDVAYAGLLLNNTRNANIGLVDGDNVAAGTGYATLRFANTNGRLGNNNYATNIYVDRVVSRGGGRGIFCVSQSGGVEINEIDLAGNGNNSILIENCYNVTINSGSINGGGEFRLAARSEFANNRDISVNNVTVTNTSVRESPCGENVSWNNVTVQGGRYDVCN